MFLSRGFEYLRGMCKAACNNGVSVIKALQVWCKPGALSQRMYKVYLLYVIRYSSNLLHAESYCSISVCCWFDLCEVIYSIGTVNKSFA